MRALVLAVLLLAGCPGARSGERGRDNAVVILRCDVPDAALWLDGRYIQEIGAMKGGISVHPGRHRIEIRHDEHFSYYSELELAPKERRIVDVDLAPILP